MEILGNFKVFSYIFFIIKVNYTTNLFSTLSNYLDFQHQMTHESYRSTFLKDSVSNVSLQPGIAGLSTFSLLSLKQVRALERLTALQNNLPNSLCLTNEGVARSHTFFCKFIFGNLRRQVQQRWGIAVEIGQNHWRIHTVMNHILEQNGMEYQE